MTEDEARDWIGQRHDGVAIARLELIAARVREESARQNLIAASTVGEIWARHIADSAQLHGLAEGPTGLWIDVGTGAGFPGLVIAALAPEREVWLVEPRRLRAVFLERMIAELGLGRVAVLAKKIERIGGEAVILSARAVAALPELFARASSCAGLSTVWLLPRGRHAAEEVALARQSWHGMFHVEQSLTDPHARIVVARNIRPKGRR